MIICRVLNYCSVDGHGSCNHFACTQFSDQADNVTITAEEAERKLALSRKLSIGGIVVGIIGGILWTILRATVASSSGATSTDYGY